MKKLAIVVAVFMLFASNLSAQSAVQDHELSVELLASYHVWVHADVALADLAGIDTAEDWTVKTSLSTANILGCAHSGTTAKITVSVDAATVVTTTANGWGRMNARVKIAAGDEFGGGTDGTPSVTWINIIANGVLGAGEIITGIPAADYNTVPANRAGLEYEVAALPGAIAGTKTANIIYTITTE